MDLIQKGYTIDVLADMTNTRVVTVTPTVGVICVFVSQSSGFKSFSELGGRSISLLQPHTKSERIAAEILCACYGVSMLTTSANKVRVSILKYPKEIEPPFGEVLLHYNDIPMDRLNFFVPFYRFETSQRWRLLLVDEVLFINSNTTDKKNNEIKKLLGVRETNKRDDDTNLFFSLFLTFYPNLPEHFTTSHNTDKKNIRFVVDKDVGARIVQRHMDEYLKLTATIPGLRLQRGDIIRFQTGTAPVKGDYTVLTWNPETKLVVVEKPPMVSFSDNFDIVQVKGMATDRIFYEPERKTLVGKLKDTVQPEQVHVGAVWFVDLKRRGVVTATDGPKKRVAIVHRGALEARREEAHVCIGRADVDMGVLHKEILTETECKKKNLIWDRRCDGDYDCPFYDPDQARGGCNTNGYCEMPIGVTQTGYRKYEGEPFCRGCPDFTNPYCCSDTKKKEFAFHTIFEPFVSSERKIFDLLKLRDTPFSLDTSFQDDPGFTDHYLAELSAKALVKVVSVANVVQAYSFNFMRGQNHAGVIVFNVLAVYAFKNTEIATLIAYRCLSSVKNKEFTFMDIKDMGDITLDKVRLLSHDLAFNLLLHHDRNSGQGLPGPLGSSLAFPGQPFV